MQISVEPNETYSILRLQGELNITLASELKGVLLATLAEGGDLQVDLERSDAIDITIMQLLWATRREADRRGTGFVIRASQTVVLAALDAGFDLFPGNWLRASNG